MYTFWKRTVPPPALDHLRRARPRKVHRRAALITNTPLQALVLLNDPTYVEAARALAQRALLEAGSDAAARVALALPRSHRPPRHARRTPRARSTSSSANSIATSKDPAQAAKLIAVGEPPKPGNVEAVELAAWTTVASTILNLDETITKE